MTFDVYFLNIYLFVFFKLRESFGEIKVELLVNILVCSGCLKGIDVNSGSFFYTKYIPKIKRMWYIKIFYICFETSLMYICIFTSFKCLTDY